MIKIVSIAQGWGSISPGGQPLMSLVAANLFCFFSLLIPLFLFMLLFPAPFHLPQFLFHVWTSAPFSPFIPLPIQLFLLCHKYFSCVLFLSQKSRFSRTTGVSESSLRSWEQTSLFVARSTCFWVLRHSFCPPTSEFI